jgi:xeroderma pigmentosum group C-complementing protein
MSLERLDAEMKSFNKDKHDPELHGERIEDIKEFRDRAKAMEGSRDVGAQLFTALLRGLGIEARMVANLQPLGFGWNQYEEASERNPRKMKDKKEAPSVAPVLSDGEEATDEDKPAPKPVKKGKGKAPAKPKNSTTRVSRGQKDAPIDLSDSEDVTAFTKADDDSLVDVTEPRFRPKPSLPYDKDLAFPHYWTEVLSPVTNTYTVVDALILKRIANTSELLETFEPRGAKADKAKQVTAYIVGYSPDGTAKDVTTRYLKRHVWPGRTKGNRMPVRIFGE